MITLRTTQGDISIELDFDKAPNTAANYLQYARDGFYNWHYLSPCDPRLYGSGRRYGCRDE